ncbi:MAG: hypothetical protein H3Z52_16000 [archaeon]|nr:hypothetical protein [archaeon]
MLAFKALISIKVFFSFAYYVSNWDETIIINEDASITIIEEVTFRFLSGDFGYA